MNMKNYTREDILNLVEEEDVGFIRLQFTDIFGTMKNVAITVSQLKLSLIHISEPTRLGMISYAVFCLKKKKKKITEKIYD